MPKMRLRPDPAGELTVLPRALAGFGGHFAAGTGGVGIGGEGSQKLHIPGSFFSPQSAPENL